MCPTEHGTVISAPFDVPAFTAVPTPAARFVHLNVTGQAAPGVAYVIEEGLAPQAYTPWIDLDGKPRPEIPVGMPILETKLEHTDREKGNFNEIRAAVTDSAAAWLGRAAGIMPEKYDCVTCQEAHPRALGCISLAATQAIKATTPLYPAPEEAPVELKESAQKFMSEFTPGTIALRKSCREAELVAKNLVTTLTAGPPAGARRSTKKAKDEPTTTVRCTFDIWRLLKKHTSFQVTCGHRTAMVETTHTVEGPWDYGPPGLFARNRPQVSSATVTIQTTGAGAQGYFCEAALLDHVRHNMPMCHCRTNCNPMIVGMPAYAIIIVGITREKTKKPAAASGAGPAPEEEEEEVPAPNTGEKRAAENQGNTEGAKRTRRRGRLTTPARGGVVVPECTRDRGICGCQACDDASAAQ